MNRVARILSRCSADTLERIRVSVAVAGPRAYLIESGLPPDAVGRLRAETIAGVFSNDGSLVLCEADPDGLRTLLGGFGGIVELDEAALLDAVEAVEKQPASGPVAGPPPFGLIVVMAAGHRIAVPAAAVERVLRAGHVRRIPHKKNCVLGMVNIGGGMVPVVDFPKSLGGDDAAEIPCAAAMLLIRADGKRAALLVDEVVGGREFPERPPVIERENPTADCLRDAVLIAGELVTLLDVSRAVRIT